MPESRRDFLAKCLGGMTIPLVAATGAQAVTNSPSSATPSAHDALALTRPSHGFRPSHHVSVETNFLPEGTRFFVDGDKPLGLVQELLIQWYPSGCYWLGLQLLLLDHDLLPGHGPVAHTRQYLVAQDDSMEVCLADDRPLNMSVLQYNRRIVPAGLDDVFLSALQTRPLRFTRPLKDLNISFMRCANCGAYDRCLRFEPEEHTEGWGPGGVFDTAQRNCPCCGFSGRQQLDFHDEKLLKKLYMTPTTSHLVFHRHPDDRFPSEETVETNVSVIPAGFNVHNRPAWLAAELQGSPVAQVLPKPSYLHDVFLASFGSLFGLSR